MNPQPLIINKGRYTEEWNKTGKLGVDYIFIVTWFMMKVPIKFRG